LPFPFQPNGPVISAYNNV